MQVPFLDLKTQNRALKAEILPLWEEILDSAAFIAGKHVSAFEEEFASACSVKHCVAVNSGTDALRFIFLALDLKPGDEVITVPNTFIATTEAITQASGNIVFVDIDPETYNMDPTKIEAAITPKTRGIVPVHLYGQPADMDPILAIAERHGLWVVEDACQAHLAEYRDRKAGSMGIAAAFSFYPGKNMGACGEGGAVTTNDEDLAAKVRMLRDHGQAKKYYHDMEGYNGRCDALQAAALRVKLKHLPAWNEARRKNAKRYFELL
ncbi:MAG: DegT/DnrJ/EryC1/StrS family aminotransferase [Deltaproteobacteria bacterium]|nr:DegT/DnrJ/EryC1/StrS family aminotransferase [Deltaproteobacteria bacterium]